MLFLWTILLTILISIVWTTYRYGIGPTPTSNKVKKILMEHLPKLPSGPIYELGAGFGTLAFALADHYPDHTVIAIEVSPIPWAWMVAIQGLHPRKNLKIIRGDFFKESLEDAKLIVCYLYPGAMQKLKEKIDRECQKAKLISHTFAFPTKTPTQVIYAHDLYHTPIYIY